MKIKRYLNMMTQLLEAFQKRFALRHNLTMWFKIFMCLFGCTIREALEILQFELINLQAYRVVALIL